MELLRPCPLLAGFPQEAAEFIPGEKKNKKTVFYCLCVVVIPVPSQEASKDRLLQVIFEEANESKKVPLVTYTRFIVINRKELCFFGVIS